MYKNNHYGLMLAIMVAADLQELSKSVGMLRNRLSKNSSSAS